jgi:hypothetical protein
MLASRVCSGVQHAMPVEMKFCTNRCKVQAVTSSDSAVLVAQSSSQIDSWVRNMAADSKLLKARQWYASIMIQSAR